MQVRYSLSVVRLADPTHCQLESLNATTAARQVLPVCGVDVAAAANASAAAAAAVAASPAPELEAAGLAQVHDLMACRQQCIVTATLVVHNSKCACLQDTECDCQLVCPVCPHAWVPGGGIL